MSNIIEIKIYFKRRYLAEQVETSHYEISQSSLRFLTSKRQTK